VSRTRDVVVIVGTSVSGLILIIALGLIAPLIVVWAAMELLELLRWTFPANKHDEKGPFK
jgi:hypothetical protein